MFTLIIGASACGKSEYAENWTLSLPGRRVYIATLQPMDNECLERIAKHQVSRAQRGFTTIECYTNLLGLKIPKDSNVLLECMGNLLANEMYNIDGGGTDALLSGIKYLRSQCAHLTVVTNEICSGGRKYKGDTMHYIFELANINRILANEADRVVEVIAGLPHIWKESAF